MDVFELIDIIKEDSQYDSYLIVPVKDDKLVTDRQIKISHKETAKQVKIELKGTYISKGLTKPKVSIPYQKIIDLWNDFATEFGRPKVKILTPEIKDYLKGRWNDQSGDYCNLEAWELVFEKVKKSFMLTHPETTWFSFKWLIKPTNFPKVMADEYDDTNCQWFLNKKNQEAISVKEANKAVVKEEPTDFELAILERMKQSRKQG